MTDQQIKKVAPTEYVLKDPMGNSFMYSLVDQKGDPLVSPIGTSLGEGCSGEVFKVRGEDNEIYALKVCRTSQVDDFRANAEGLYQDKNNLEHFIKTVRVGDVMENGKSVPAMIMEYGGTDLRRVYDHLSEKRYLLQDSDKNKLINVVEAFEYKVLVTVAEGLAHAEEKELGEEKKGIYHGDLIPSNILCGFDLNEVAGDVAKLEKALLKGRITLCDRLINEKVGTKALGGPSYTQGLAPNALFFDIYCPSLSPVGNSWSLLALWSWFSSGGEGKILPVDMFASLKKFKYEFDTKKYERVLNTVGEFSNLLEKAIDAGKYFFKPRATREDGTNYPLIYRPVDVFENFSSEHTKLDVSSLKNYHEEYLKMKVHGGTKSTLDEKKKMELIYDKNVFEKATQLSDLIGTIVAQRKPFEDKEGELQRQLSVHEENVAGEQKNIAEATQSIKELVERVSKEMENTKIADEMKKEQKRLTLAKSKLGGYQSDMTKNKKEILAMQEKQKEYDDRDYLGVLQYLKESLLPDVVEDQFKDEIKEVLKGCGLGEGL